MTDLTSPADELGAMDIFHGCPPEDLTELAGGLSPLRATAGEVLMRQGELAESFLLIASGSARVEHTGDDGSVTTDEVTAGMVVGEIALLRGGRRTATVTTSSALAGWIGGTEQFTRLIHIPTVLERLVRVARERLAAQITPLPIKSRTGTELLLRPVLPGDSERIMHGHVRFSAETIYRRFMTARPPNAALMHYLSAVDYVDHFVWVVTAPDGSPIAEARFVRDHDRPTEAELAFTVGDAYQGQGIGSFLLGALTIVARLDGVEQFSARVLSENAPMRAILDRHRVHWLRDEPGVVTTVFDVPEDVPFDDDLAARIKAVACQVTQTFG